MERKDLFVAGAALFLAVGAAGAAQAQSIIKCNWQQASGVNHSLSAFAIQYRITGETWEFWDPTSRRWAIVRCASDLDPSMQGGSCTSQTTDGSYRFEYSARDTLTDENFVAITTIAESTTIDRVTGEGLRSQVMRGSWTGQPSEEWSVRQPGSCEPANDPALEAPTRPRM
jgi:opacity protein-like surface antigen